jgi:D-glycero-D-manno-heptose 1,7-bisphosphate phosphatase
VTTAPLEPTSATAARRGALFLDRDGTIIVDEHYLGDETRVRLLPGAARAVRRANAAGVFVVVVTNQSGIGRGLITNAQYQRVAARVIALLAEHDAYVDATYYCPHAPASADACECRKPGLGMYQQAARALSLDLASSAYIGDKWRDIAPALAANGLGILVPAATTPPADLERAVLSAHTSPDLEQAVAQALSWMRASR